jgi:hypothetical protein
MMNNSNIGDEAAAAIAAVDGYENYASITVEEDNIFTQQQINSLSLSTSDDDPSTTTTTFAPANTSLPMNHTKETIAKDSTNNEKTIISDKETTMTINATTTTRPEAATTTYVLLPDPSCIPISIVRCYRIDKYNIDVNITVQLFHERTVVTCSQNKNGKINTWLLCQPNINPYTIRNSIQWDVTHLLGGGGTSSSSRRTNRDDPLLIVYCQRISTLFYDKLQQRPKTTLFGFALYTDKAATTAMNGGHEPELFHTIVDVTVNTMIEAMELSLSKI